VPTDEWRERDDHKRRKAKRDGHGGREFADRCGCSRAARARGMLMTIPAFSLSSVTPFIRCDLFSSARRVSLRDASARPSQRERQHATKSPTWL